MLWLWLYLCVLDILSTHFSALRLPMPTCYFWFSRGVSWVRKYSACFSIAHYCSSSYFDSPNSNNQNFRAALLSSITTLCGGCGEKLKITCLGFNWGITIRKQYRPLLRPFSSLKQLAAAHGLVFLMSFVTFIYGSWAVSQVGLQKLPHFLILSCIILAS